MTAHAAKRHDPHNLRGGETPLSERGPAPKPIVVAYGFWIFLLTDFVMFSGFFAAYAVLAGATAGGPSGRDLFDLTTVGWETAFLLASSFACGLAGIATMVRRTGAFQLAMAATALLGLGFLALEVNEFGHLIAEGNGPQRSAFLSSFFALVGCHGVHVTLGLAWLTTMMAQVWAKGFRDDILRRIACFALFWHALDIIWVALFTVVYLFAKVPPGMSEFDLTPDEHGDTAPGLADEAHGSPRVAIGEYVVGLVLAALLTAASFTAVGGGLIWGPGVPVALVALAIGQMGVHLVFFLHVTTGPDNTNNTLALAFGVLIIGLVLVGTLWIMANLSHTMMPMDALMRMQR